MKNKNYIEEQINDFLINYTRTNPNNFIQSNTIYNYFCFIYQKNTKMFTIQSFMYYFNKCFEKQNAAKITKTILKQNKTTISYINDLELIPLQNFDLFGKQLQNPIDKKPLLTPELTVQSTGIQQTQIQPVSTTEFSVIEVATKKLTRKSTKPVNTDKINLFDFINLFDYGPNIGKYETTFLFNYYKTFYKQSPEHLEYIPHINKFKQKFEKHWYIHNPNCELNLKARIGRNGKGIGNILIKKEL